jgi:peptidoglycan/LPS O-acetylase OafA/YrhL
LKKYYIKEINFLRFLSITAVVSYHYFPEIIPNGYLGVDLFFVISGFLISLYLYKEIDDKKFSLINFYNRRIKRIIPATIFLLYFVTSAVLLLFTKIHLTNFSESLIHSIFFTSNFYFWLDGGYFGASDKIKPLLHFWSLSVEEQFYLFFPIFFYLILKFFKSLRIIFFIIFIFSILSFLLNIFLLNLQASNPAFFLLPTRIWNFGLGVLAMLLFISKNKTHSNFEIFILTFLLIVSFFFKAPHLPQNFLVIFISFLILRKKFPIFFFLDFVFHNKIIQYIGLISFSLYLWHWPLLVLVEYYYVYELNIFKRIFTLLFAILASILSYHLVEINFRNKFKTQYLYILISISYIFFIIFFLFVNSGHRNIYEKNSPNFIANSALTNYKCEISNYIFYKSKRACLINNKQDIEKYEIAILGNSHAQMYVPSIEPHLVKYKKKAILLPMTGCLPTIDVNINKSCLEKSNTYFLDYSLDPNIKTVIIATTWSHKKIYNGKKYINDPNHEILSKSILNLINILKENDKQVFLVSPLQIPTYDLPLELSRLLKFNHISDKELLNELEVDRNVYDNEYKFVNSFFLEKLKKNYLQINKLQCDNQKCYYSNNEGIFFADESHISKFGAKYFSKLFEIVFE